MKKILSAWLALALILSITTFSACNKPTQNEHDPIHIVVTIFPFYDWIREIIGPENEQFEVTLLVKNGADLHNYQPSVDDIVKISTCDFFVYTGGESDQWVQDVLSSAQNQDMTVINLIDVLGEAAKKEEWKEGMQPAGESQLPPAEQETDEHIWLSLKNASFLCSHLAEKLASFAQDKDPLISRAQAYIEKLQALDAKYQKTIEESKMNTLVVGDRFPFQYLTADYGLDYYAAFSGCSAETEASFETIVFLANKLDELNLSSIIITESSDGSIAQTIIQNTKNKNQKIVTLNSLQSVLFSEAQQGTSYLSIMEENCNILQAALSK